MKSISMKSLTQMLFAVAALVGSAQASAQITLYEHDGFGGRSFTAERRVGDFGSVGFNDRASSAVVQGDRWEVCEDSGFGGRCVVLPPGRYSSLTAMGFNDRVSSARIVNVQSRYDRDDERAPERADYRRRKNEKLFSANVLSVKAVVGTPEQRCWMEQEQVVQERRSKVPGAVVGGLLGGILGHQIGGGTGRDIATAGGAVAGAVVGANVGGRKGETVTRDVQKCADVQGSKRADYWDVVYNFRGQEHRVQTTSPPGATIMVNAQGEPRV